MHRDLSCKRLNWGILWSIKKRMQVCETTYPKLHVSAKTNYMITTTYIIISRLQKQSGFIAL